MSRIEGPISIEQRESAKWVDKQFGGNKLYLAINEEIWKIINSRPDRLFLLSDTSAVAKAVSCNPDDVLPVLAILSAPSVTYLTMEYVDKDLKLVNREVGEYLTKWHRDKTVSDKEWKDYASEIRVQWRGHRYVGHHPPRTLQWADGPRGAMGTPGIIDNALSGGPVPPSEKRDGNT